MTGKGIMKVIFFCIALGFGFVTFFTALEVYIESYANVPPVAKRTVAIMTYMFFASWGSFPALFLLGPEGFGHMNQNWSTIMHSIADLFSKNLWGIYGWYLRIQVAEPTRIHLPLVRV
jgi:bacteriorhodopsin